MLRWCRMVENQPTLWTTLSGSHASTTRAARAARPRRPGRRLATANLFRARAAQYGFHLGRLARLGWDEDAEPIVRKPRVVHDLAGATRRERGIQQNAENGRKRAEENRHLEHDDDIGRNRADRFTADLDRPVFRHPQREPGADGAPGDAADQGEHPHRTDGLGQRIFELVARNRRVHREIGMTGLAELLDRRDRRIEVSKHTEHAGFRRRAEELANGAGQPQGWTHRDAATLPRRGGGSTSFTSEIETAGKFFTNRRNHMKNQPNEPAMMPQSAQVGL